MSKHMISCRTHSIKKNCTETNKIVDINPSEETSKLYRVNSIEEYLSAIDHIFKLLCKSGETDQCTLWYRGQVQTNFNLLPTIARPKDGVPINPLYETVLLSKFKSLAIPYVQNLPGFPLPDEITSYWSWLFMLRHYGLPARILDWSSDPLTALFFATDPTDSSLKEGTDAAVWLLNPVTLNTAFSFHSYLKPGYIPNVEEPSFHLYFGPNSELLSTTKPAAAIGPNNTTRIVAQKGSFIVYPRVKELISLEKQPDSSNYLYKINIAWESFEDIRIQLNHYGVTRLSLYPDIENIAGEVIQQVKEESVETT